MSRFIFALDAIALPIPDEATTAIAEAPNTFDSLGGLIFPALALVAVAALGIVIFSRKTKTE